MSNVLVVDDDEDIRELLEIILIEEGYGVRCVESATEALTLVIEQQPDLILTDLRLGRESGAALIESYRQLPDARARVVLVSGMAGLREEAARLGADDFLVKPFGLDELVSTVARACPCAAAAN